MEIQGAAGHHGVILYIIKSKKPIGLKKRIYWLNGTKEDK